MVHNMVKVVNIVRAQSMKPTLDLDSDKFQCFSHRSWTRQRCTAFEHRLVVAWYAACVLLVSSPDPAPKRRGKGLGTGERLLGLAGFGCARRHRQSSNKPRIWLVSTLCCYIPAGSKSYDRAKAVIWLVYLKTKLLMMHNQENACQSPDPFPLLFGTGSGNETSVL